MKLIGHASVGLFLGLCVGLAPLLVGQEGRFTAAFLNTNFVNVSGDTMTGALDVSAKGLVEGHHAGVYLANAQTLTTAKTTRVGWDAEWWDEDDEHDITTVPGRFTAGLAGKYEVEGALTFSSNASGNRAIYVMKNANTSPDPSSADVALIAMDDGISLAKAPTTFPFHATVDLAATDYVEVFVLQSAGFNLDLTAPSGTPTVIMNHATFRRVGE